MASSAQGWDGGHTTSTEDDMQRRITTFLAALALLLIPAASRADAGPAGAGGQAGAGGHGSSNANGWYLALGDSWAAGYQYAQGDDPTGGYAGHVLDALRQDQPKSKLVNLACSGATTTSMIAGGGCAYDEGTQLAQAVEFLHAHARNTRLVTLDIGGNDIAKCAYVGLVPSCVNPALATLRTNVPQILSTLRAAAGPGVQIVLLNYPDPFLAFWLLDTPTSTADDIYRQLAVASVQVLAQVNGILTGAATAVGADTADVSAAFSTTDFTTQASLPGVPGTVPLNVARVCQWTTMCTVSDFHPNDAGYAVVASAVVARL
jgi:lysophospholipase L1-like esterase